MDTIGGVVGGVLGGAPGAVAGYFAGKAMENASYETYIKIENNTNMDIADIKLSEMNSSEWQSSRPDRNLANCHVQKKGYIRQRAEIKAHARENKFTMTLMLSDDDTNKVCFRADQRIAKFGKHYEPKFGEFWNSSKDLEFSVRNNYSGFGKYKITCAREGHDTLVIKISGDPSADTKAKKKIGDLRSQYERGEYDRIILSLREAIRINPNDTEFYKKAIQALEKIKTMGYEEAIDILKKGTTNQTVTQLKQLIEAEYTMLINKLDQMDKKISSLSEENKRLHNEAGKQRLKLAGGIIQDVNQNTNNRIGGIQNQLNTLHTDLKNHSSTLIRDLKNQQTEEGRRTADAFKALQRQIVQSEAKMLNKQTELSSQSIKHASKLISELSQKGELRNRSVLEKMGNLLQAVQGSEARLKNDQARLHAQMMDQSRQLITSLRQDISSEGDKTKKTLEIIQRQMVRSEQILKSHQSTLTNQVLNQSRELIEKFSAEHTRTHAQTVNELKSLKQSTLDSEQAVRATQERLSKQIMEQNKSLIDTLSREQRAEHQETIGKLSVMQQKMAESEREVKETQERLANQLMKHSETLTQQLAEKNTQESRAIMLTLEQTRREIQTESQAIQQHQRELDAAKTAGDIRRQQELISKINAAEESLTRHTSTLSNTMMDHASHLHQDQMNEIKVTQTQLAATEANLKNHTNQLTNEVLNHATLLNDRTMGEIKATQSQLVAAEASLKGHSNELTEKVLANQTALSQEALVKIEETRQQVISAEKTLTEHATTLTTVVLDNVEKLDQRVIQGIEETKRNISASEELLKQHTDQLTNTVLENAQKLSLPSVQEIERTREQLNRSKGDLEEQAKNLATMAAIHANTLHDQLINQMVSSLPVLETVTHERTIKNIISRTNTENQIISDKINSMKENNDLTIKEILDVYKDVHELEVNIKSVSYSILPQLTSAAGNNYQSGYESACELLAVFKQECVEFLSQLFAQEREITFETVERFLEKKVNETNEDPGTELRNRREFATNLDRWGVFARENNEQIDLLTSTVENAKTNKGSDNQGQLVNSIRGSSQIFRK